MSAIQSLKLHHFRCYEQASLHALSAGLIVLYGANGAGKTNILEAVSLLSPGRGLRGARAGEVQKQNISAPWAVSGTLYSDYEEVRIGTGLDPLGKAGQEKRVIRVNGQMEKSQSVLARYLSCIWLTPQMDRLFLDSSRDRRKFLDRLVFAFDAGHARRVSLYENALAQRSRLLKTGRADDLWLGGLEQQMAETAVAIAAARMECIDRLQIACDSGDHTHFPLARLGVQGVVEDSLRYMPALAVEEKFRHILKESRPRDSVSGGAVLGAHKTDFIVSYAAKNMPAAQCSTGEQKALLIGIILAHTRLMKAERKHTPILLLDEVAAHLDEQRRAALYEILQDLRVQAWLTGTDENLFTFIKPSAQFFSVAHSVVRQESLSEAC